MSTKSLRVLNEALRSAARSGADLEVRSLARKIVAGGGNVDECPAFTYSALETACQNGHLEAVKALLEAGARVDFKHTGRPPIHYACRYAHAQVLQTLLAAGANPNDTDAVGCTPAMYIAASNEPGTPECFDLLAAAGARFDVRDEDGNDAMLIAFRANATNAYQWLLAKGDPVDRANYKGQTPLMWAAKNASVDAFEHLLNLGCDLGAKDRKGRDAHEWATYSGSTDIVAFIDARLESKALAIDTAHSGDAHTTLRI